MLIHKIQGLQSFLNKKLDFENKDLDADLSFLSLEGTYSALNLQVFFTFLNVSHVFITDEGKLIGIIGKEDFIKNSMSIN